MKLKGHKVPASHEHSEVHKKGSFSLSTEVSLPQKYFKFMNSMWFCSKFGYYMPDILK